MLSKILEEMWVEPEVLEALSEEQKRILFLKMREEQVRRWREREEREEREGGDDNNNRPKKADNKHVRWLLGRDGDVSVSVIGEVDEFRSSKLLQSLMSSRVHADNMNAIQTSDLPTGRDCIQLSLTDVNDDPAPPRHQWSEEESCSTDDDPKDPADADSDSESGGSSVNWAPLNRPHLSSHGNRPPLKAQLSDAGRAGRQNKDPSQYGGRVARLRKAFSEDRQLPPAYNKPTIPAKPAHLQKRSTPLIR